MADLLDLAARVEVAEGPDREFDREIFLAIHHPEYTFPSRVLNRKPKDLLEALMRMYWDGGGGSTYRDVLYTASLDAAMTLVGEGWWISDLHERADKQRTIVTLCAKGGSANGIADAKAPTPALALCAAALRARSVQP